MKKFFELLLISTVTLFLMISIVAKADYSDSYGVSHYTRYDLESMIKHKNDYYAQLPKYDSNKIKNIPNSTDQFNTQYKGLPLDVWDNWVLKNADGTVANYHGYHIMFGLAGNTDKMSLLYSKIYMFYQRVSDNGKSINTWKNAGPVFLNNLEGAKNTNSSVLKNADSEWSGSAFMNKKGKIRLFYTAVTTSNINQWICTSIINVKKNKSGLIIKHNLNRDRKVIFSGDGKYYDTFKSFKQKNLKDDSFAVRDPNYFEANGHKYLVFQSNTGYGDGPSGYSQLNNRYNYGGSKQFYNYQLNAINNNQDLKDKVISSNGALGLVELNNNYSIKKVMKPLVVFNDVSDEFERPSIIHYKNKWYIFTVGHGAHMLSLEKQNDIESFMIGFVSNNFDKGYKPLNKNGLVIHSDQEWSDPTFSYSYGVIQNKENPFVINDYMNSIQSHSLGHYSTFGQSILMNINGNRTNILKKSLLQQGQLIYKK